MSTLCSFPECKKQSTFNYEGETKGIYCVEHKKSEMVDVKNPSCKDCKKRPSFNYEGETKAIYCAEHKKDNMIDIRKKTCKDCKKGPCYNYEGQSTPIYCAEHKKDGMINVKSPTCKDCKKISTYNFEGQSKPIYCFEHKKDGMINVRNSPCKECKKGACYNYEGQSKPIYCAEHKKDGMINVKDKTCLDCKKQPNFNYEGEYKGIYCADHKKDGMINVKCSTCKDCKRQPRFNYEGHSKGSYCAEHKKDGMINVINPTCKSEWCNIQIRNKYDGYCLFCYMHLFPDKPVTRNYKTKEFAVVDFVKNTFPQITWVSDKIVKDGCSRKRPDLLLDLGYQVLIVEVDENQHRDYDCSCENKRLMQLSQDVGHRPIVFIRFNPDDYNEQDKNITSCWGTNKKGICVIKKYKINEWNDRLKDLSSQIQYWINPDNITNKTIQIIELFYDK